MVLLRDWLALYNGLGLYDGLSGMLGQILLWGLPYLVGRLYFSNLEGLRVFTVAMVIGGLLYVLPCHWEMRMSPHLLRPIYGRQFRRSVGGDVADGWLSTACLLRNGA